MMWLIGLAGSLAIGFALISLYSTAVELGGIRRQLEVLSPAHENWNTLERIAESLELLQGGLAPTQTELRQAADDSYGGLEAIGPARPLVAIEEYVRNIAVAADEIQAALSSADERR